MEVVTKKTWKRAKNEGSDFVAGRRGVGSDARLFLGDTQNAFGLQRWQWWAMAGGIRATATGTEVLSRGSFTRHDARLGHE